MVFPRSRGGETHESIAESKCCGRWGRKANKSEDYSQLTLMLVRPNIWEPDCALCGKRKRTAKL
jgi:hypothetical protein